MATNFTKTAFLGQAPDMASDQVQNAIRTYQNIIKILGPGHGSSEVSIKMQVLQEAQPLIQQAEGLFPGEILNMPQINSMRKAINRMVSGLNKAINAFHESQKRQAARIEVAQKEEQDQTRVDEAADFEGKAAANGKNQFPIVPVAIAGGALALALLIGG